MIFQEAILNWGENPLSVSQIKSSNEVMGWGEKAIEIRSIDRGLLNGVFMHKRPNKLKFLTEKNDKVFFASVQSPTNSQGRAYNISIPISTVKAVEIHKQFLLTSLQYCLWKGIDCSWTVFFQSLQ